MRFFFVAAVCWSWLSGGGLLPVGGFAEQALAQDSSEEAVYLEEMEPEPPAKIVRRQKIKEVYEDKEVRAEREIAWLSDERSVNDGLYTEYYHDGTKYAEGKFAMGVFEGQWQYWFPNGQLCKAVSFKDGKPDGQWEVFNKEGVLEGVKSYRDGRREGKWVAYHEDGKTPRMELEYLNGKPSGERVVYYPSGKKRQVINFKEGIIDGIMIEWDEEGVKRAEAEFQAGKIVGQVRRFNSDSETSP